MATEDDKRNLRFVTRRGEWEIYSWEIQKAEDVVPKPEGEE